MSEVQPAESRPWTFTVVRVHGLQHLRAEKSWRPILTLAVGDHQRHELKLGCDGQNPNLKERLRLRDMNASSCIDMCVYHQASSKKKNKKRNLVASACYTLQELLGLQARQQCKQRSVEIQLNCVSQPSKGANKSKSATVFLVARLGLPEVNPTPPTCVQEGVKSDIPNKDQEYSSSPTSDSSEDPIFVWPEAHHLGPKVHTGYWSDSDQAQSENERDPSLKPSDNNPILVSQLWDSEDGDHVQNADDRHWVAASLLPTSTATISINSQILIVDSIVDSFSPYRELREAQGDADYERVLTRLCAEWTFVGGSLVALSGLEASVFGFSSGSAFTISTFARGAIAVGSVASGIGLVIDAWFLLAYCNASPVKFQRMAVDVYGKYLFFCISARVPALCMFASALALMIFLLSVAWTTWPTAVLVMSFMAGILVCLQFIVYGVHSVVVFITGLVQRVQRGIVECFMWTHPPPPDAREMHNQGR